VRLPFVGIGPYGAPPMYKLILVGHLLYMVYWRVLPPLCLANGVAEIAEARMSCRRTPNMV
jgi:hypothetical protein